MELGSVAVQSRNRESAGRVDGTSSLPSGPRIAVGMLLGLSVAGGAAVGLVAWAVDLPDVVVGALLLGVVATATWTSGSYVWRHRRP